MLTPFAKVEDLADWLGETIEESSADYKRAKGALRMASALVRTETGKDWTNGQGGIEESIPEALELVTLQSAARGFMNPRGQTSDNESIDDYITGGRFLVEESGIYLTSSERSMLAPLSGRRFGGIGTVSRTRGESAPWGDLGDGSDERILPPYY